MLALIAVIIAAILLLPSCGSRGGKAEADTESTTLVKAGDKAPDFTVEMFDGTKTSLAELKGKVVLLNFWATWCPKKMVIKFTPLLESPYRITLVVPVIKILSPVFIWHPNKFNFCCPELPLTFLNLNGRKAKYVVCRMAMAILLHNSFLFPATYITTSRKY